LIGQTSLKRGKIEAFEAHIKKFSSFFTTTWHLVELVSWGVLAAMEMACRPDWSSSTRRL